MRKHWLLSLLTIACVTVGARGQNLIVNGDFEAGGGSLTGWTVVNQAGGVGNWFAQTGVKSPFAGTYTVPAPAGGHAAMSDQDRPGSHVLYQDFVVPASVTSATFTFDRFRGNRGTQYYPPAGLDYTTPNTQQARVDIMTTTAAPFSVLPADVLLTIWTTNVGDPLIDAAYITQNTNLTAFLAARTGQTLRLRFAEADNAGIFQFGVDNVSLIVSGATPAPPPSGSNGGEGSYPGSGGGRGAEGTYGFGGGQALRFRAPILSSPTPNDTGHLVHNISHRQDAVTVDSSGPTWLVVTLGIVLGASGLLVLGIAVLRNSI